MKYELEMVALAESEAQKDEDRMRRRKVIAHVIIAPDGISTKAIPNRHTASLSVSESHIPYFLTLFYIYSFKCMITSD